MLMQHAAGYLGSWMKNNLNLNFNKRNESFLTQNTKSPHLKHHLITTARLPVLASELLATSETSQRPAKAFWVLGNGNGNLFSGSVRETTTTTDSSI